MAKRLWAKVDCLFFEECASLNAAQQVAFLRLVLNCKRHQTDGAIDANALIAERVSKGSLTALMDMGLVETNGDAWVIPKYVEWQGSAADIRAAKSAAGKAGAIARWGDS